MHDLIVFGEDFGGLPSSTQHLIKRLAQNRKIVWVNSIGLRQPKLNRKDISRAANKLMGKSKGDTQGMSDAIVHPNITIVNLKTIPAPQSNFVRKMAKDLILKQLLPIIEKLNLNQPILWSSLPTAADICGHLGEYAVVYYCGDDFSSLAGVDHKTVNTHEQKMSQKANLIFAASDAIRDKFPKCKTQLLPHGVDVELFSTPTVRADDLPSSHRPIAGFYGSLSEWLDYDLITNVATALPDWDFVFIGPNELETLLLPSLANVHYLGAKPHAELPRYSQHWDVSLLPFKSNKQIQACSPLKLMEYLATGTPIVTTDFPAMHPYRHYLHPISTSNEMIRALEVARHEPRLRTDIVSDESWDNRSQFVSWMLELL
ncbi:glycosyltransferase family 1 protein [Vibrio sp. 03-59-1]|uniref:glycosyltransferase n=1 Tax=Vibrio sp. 03-59-1 TaxID=2607607 RepID=UPI001493A5F8|nr:glycosyltransferase [Vibrio sp. 03-59-1]NOH84366.1 glycosyltransferase family 1 protein [Vibrio sp. 03-59-1]